MSPCNRIKYSLLMIGFLFLVIIPDKIINRRIKRGPINSNNVLGGELAKCTEGTGFYRDGYCETGEEDKGTHVVCAIVNDEFLNYTKSQGNDLSTPSSDHNFPGLKAQDRWCLCGYRFEEARKAGFAPKVDLDATHIKAKQFTPIEELEKYASNKRKRKY